MNTIKSIMLSAFLFSSFFIYGQDWIPEGQGLLDGGYGTYAVSVVDENIVWATSWDLTVSSSIPADHLIVVLKSVDGGETWDRYEVDEAMGRISFDMKALDENTAFITTQDFGGGAGRGIFKTIDGGESWTEVYDNAAGGVWVRFFNEMEGIVINRDEMATTTDAGQTWTPVPSANIPEFGDDESTLIASGNNSCTINEDHIWFGTNEGRVFRSKDKGYNWEVFNTGFPDDAIIFSVAFKDPLNGMCLNYNNGGAQFAKTSDGGETWQTVSYFPPVNVANIASVANAEGTFVANSPIFGLPGNWKSMYTEDFGAAWTTIQSGKPYTGIEFFDSNVGWSGTGAVTSEDDPALYKWEGDIFVGTQRIEKEQFNIFPNPFQSSVNIEGAEVNNITQIQLIDNAGRIIQTIDNPQEATFDFKNIGLGIYYLKIIGEEYTTTQSLIKVN